MRTMDGMSSLRSRRVSLGIREFIACLPRCDVTSRAAVRSRSGQTAARSQAYSRTGYVIPLAECRVSPDIHSTTRIDKDSEEERQKVGGEERSESGGGGRPPTASCDAQAGSGEVSRGWGPHRSSSDDRERINELYTTSSKKPTAQAGGRTTAGASVDSNGKLIWD